MRQIQKESMRFSVMVAALVFSLVFSAGIKESGAAPTLIPDSFSSLARDAKPAVVNISTVKVIQGGGRVFKHFFGQPFGGDEFFRDFLNPRRQAPRSHKQSSLGSGFIVSRDGYIVTNNHVVENADHITVKLSDETEYKAKVVGTDSNTDLALIKIEAHGLTPLKLGSSDDLEVGTWVVAIGSPFGLEQTVTAGIVSAKGRIIGSGPYDDFIQTDASINPGNSGGPLLNLDGEVVGINTAIIASGQGIGFAIPSDMAKGIIEQLKESGEVRRGWMGVAIQDITPELAEYYKLKQKNGVLIAKVYKGDPADKAGIIPGDIIIKIQGKKVKNSRDLSTTIAGQGVGTKVVVTLIRNGKRKTVWMKLTRRSDSEPGAKSLEAGYDEFGIEWKELNDATVRQFGYPEGVEGLVVTDLKTDGRADGAGIRKGDLLVEINHRSVESYEDYQKVLSTIDTGQVVQFLFRRGSTSFVAIRLIK